MLIQNIQLLKLNLQKQFLKEKVLLREIIMKNNKLKIVQDIIKDDNK